MARYSKGSQQKVKRAMDEMKEGKLKSGRSGKKVTDRKQAIAIGLSEARKQGSKVPKAPAKKKAVKKSAPKKRAAKTSGSSRTKSARKKSTASGRTSARKTASRSRSSSRRKSSSR